MENISTRVSICGKLFEIGGGVGGSKGFVDEADSDDDLSNLENVIKPKKWGLMGSTDSLEGAITMAIAYKGWR